MRNFKNFQCDLLLRSTVPVELAISISWGHEELLQDRFVLFHAGFMDICLERSILRLISLIQV